MAMDALNIWIEEFNKLPLDPTGLVAPALVTLFIQQRVQRKLSLSLYKFFPDVEFIWASPIFLSAITPICVTPSIITAIPAAMFANAWAESIMASVNIIVPIGAETKISSFLPTLGTNKVVTNGVVGQVVALIDLPSIQRGYSIIFNKLKDSSPSVTSEVFPSAFFEGFSALTISIAGVDTTPTPTGPLPIVISFCPVA